MSDRERELAAWHAELRLRCALQRRAVGTEVQNITTRFGAFDRVAALARSTLLNPGVLLAGIVALLVFGRTRGLHSVGRIALLGAATLRLWRIAKTL